MRKLTLRLDDLAVEGFSTTPAPRDRGTVRGEQACTCYGPTCEGSCYDETCADTCWFTCMNTCMDTCDDWTCLETCGFSNCETRCGAAGTCRCPFRP
ncbi:MAG TPA: hypothetical protein VF006_23670 [Longimicrobium sp.]